MAISRKIYTSQNQYLEDVARSTGYFDDSYYAKAKETGQDLEYLQMIASAKDNPPSIDRGFYDRLSTEDKFNYFAAEQFMNKSSDEYKVSQQYFDAKRKEFRNQDIYEGLNGFEKTIHSIGGWLGNAATQVLGIVEGLVDFAVYNASTFAQLTGVPAMFGVADELHERTKEFAANDITGYTAVQDAMNEYINQYTFLDKNFAAKVVNDVTAGVVRMLPMLIPGAGQIGYIIYLASAAGQTVEADVRANSDIGFGALLGHVGLSTGIEALTEWASGKIFGDDIISSIMKGEKFAPTGNIIKMVAKNSFTEGLEEVVAEFFGGFLYNSLVDPTAPAFDIKTILYAGLIGGLTGGLMAGGNVLTTTRKSVLDGKLVNTKDLTKAQKKQATNLGLRKSYGLQALVNQAQQQSTQTTEVTKLLAKYGTSLDDIRTNHADEYKDAIVKDIDTKKHQAKVILDLANLYQTIGVEQFQKSAKFLNEHLVEAQTLIDNYHNHTDVGNKAASEVFSALYPNETFSPVTIPSKPEQTLAQNIRKQLPNVKVVFGEFGHKEGLAHATISQGGEYIFIRSGLVEELGYEKVLQDVVKYEIANDLIKQLPTRDADKLATMAMGKDAKYSELTHDQKLAVTQMICFDQMFNQKTFFNRKDVHIQLFDYISKQTDKSRNNITKFNTLLKIRNTFLKSISDAVANQEDMEWVKNRYNLSDEEYQQKIKDATRINILNNTIKLTQLTFAEETISRLYMMKELLFAINTEGEFDWARLYDETYYNEEFVSRIKQYNADFKLGLAQYVAVNYNTQINAVAIEALQNVTRNQLSEKEIRKAGEELLTKEFMATATLEDIQDELANKLFWMAQTDPKVLDFAADSIIVTDDQIQGTGKLKYCKGVNGYGLDLREEQDWNARKSTEKELSRLAKDTTKSEQERYRELKERLRESPNHEVVENDEYLINIQKPNTYTQSQKNIIASVKKFFGVKCAFYGGEIYNTETNEYELSYGFTDGDTIFLKYRDNYDFVRLEHIIQHENFHILAKQNHTKFENFMNVIIKNLSEQDVKDLSNDLSKSLPNLTEDELLEEIGAMFVSGELSAWFSDTYAVTKAVDTFYKNTKTTLVPKISYLYGNVGHGVVYVEQQKQNIAAFHAVGSFEYLINAIENNSLTGASVAIGERPATGYGDYVFVINPKRIDPSANEFSMVWNGDAYTVTHPNFSKDFKSSDFQKITKELKSFLDDFELPEIRKQQLIENFIKEWKGHINEYDSLKRDPFEWTPDEFLARLYYLANNTEANIKEILRDSLWYDDYIYGSIKTTPVESFLKRHQNITKDTKDLKNVLTDMLTKGEIDEKELYFIPEFFGFKRSTIEEKIKILATSIEHYFEGRHIVIVPDILFEKTHVYAEDVIDYYNDLFKNISFKNYFKSDRGDLIEATTDALFEYYWTRKGVDKTHEVTDEGKVMLSGLQELSTIEDIKLQAAHKISDYFEHKTSHYRLSDTILNSIKTLKERLNISQSTAVKLLRDAVKSSGLHKDIIELIYKATNRPIDPATLDAVSDVVSEVRQVRNIYFEAKIYDTIDIKNDVGAIMVPNDISDNQYLKLRNRLDKYAPNVEIIEYDGYAEMDTLIQTKELFRKKPKLFFDKAIKKQTSDIKKSAAAKTPTQIATSLVDIVKTSPMDISTAQGFDEEVNKEYRKLSRQLITDNYRTIFGKINDKNWKEIYQTLKSSTDPEAQAALTLMESYLFIDEGYQPLKDRQRFSEESALEIQNTVRLSETLAAQKIGMKSAALSEKAPVSEFKQKLQENGFEVSVSDDMVSRYVPELKDKKQFEKDINEQITSLEKQIDEGDYLDQAELNGKLKELYDKKHVLLNETNEKILDWVMESIDIQEEAAKIQKDVFEQMIKTGVKAAETEGKKAVAILVDDKTTAIQPFPKTTQWVQKNVKRLKSFRMWAMLTSPVSWVRNWVGNAGMTALDSMTNQMEKWLTARQPKLTADELVALEKEANELSRITNLTPKEQSRLTEINNRIARHYDFKFVETKASKDLKKQIAENYKNTLQQILNGEDVKYETSAEKAAHIRRAERDITKSDANASLRAKLWAACQSMTDWGLNTGWFGDNAVALNSLVKNFANMVESNKEYLIKSLTTEYGKNGRGMSDARKALVEKALKSKDSMDIVNAMSKTDVELFMDSCKQRTFEQYFKNSNWLSNWAANLSQKHPIAASLTSLVLPFPRVAANVLSMAYKYSPLGFISAIKQWSVVRQMDKKGFTGVRDAFAHAKLSRTTSQATIGTLMTIAGLIFAALGVIDIDEDDYLGPSLKIGDWKLSLSNLAPSMTTFSVGAAMMWAWKNDKSAAIKALDVLYDNTLLGNIENVFRYGSLDKYLIQNLSINYASQYVPAMLKLFARVFSNQATIDKTGGYLAKLLKTFGSGIPGIANLLPKKINPYTGEIVTGTGSHNVFFNFMEAISPLDMRWDSKSATQKEAERLGTMSNGLSGSFKVNDKEYLVDKVTYSKYRANYINDTFSAILSGKQKVTVENEDGKRITTTYDKLTDKQKKNVLSRLYTDATNITKIKWWIDSGNQYVVTNKDLYNEYRSIFKSGNIIYRKTWTKSKFVER